MPNHARRPCKVGGCQYLQPCPNHPDKPRNDTRPSSLVRGYGTDWKKKRTAFIAANPICIDCGNPSVTPDHEPPRRELIARGVTNPDDDQYLVPRCWSCHSRKTAKQDGGFGNPIHRPR